MAGLIVSAGVVSGRLVLGLDTGELIDAGQVQGPQGLTGDRGPMGNTGKAGQDGNGVLSGEGPPTMEDGRNGDFWYDVTEASFYGPKNPTTGWGRPIYLRNGTGISLQGTSGPAATSTFSTTDSIAPQNVLPKLQDLTDVHQGYHPQLGEMPIWSYPAGQHATDGQFFFKTPNAHIKTWDPVPFWEPGAVVYHRAELWRAVHENANVEPALEEGKLTLFINSPGEPTFGLVPMGLGAGPPPSGNVNQPQSKYAYYVDYQNDTQIFIWKWVVKGINSTTRIPYGIWELKNTWACIVWRSLVPPPSKFPPNVVMAWIYGNNTVPVTPVLGQQKWALLEIDGHLATCKDVGVTNPKHGDVLTYDAVAGVWKAIHAPTSSGRHPVRLVTENPVLVAESDYTILLKMPSATVPIVTLPDPTTCSGRELHFKNYAASPARSDSNNVRSSLDYDTLTNTITAASDGSWSTLVSDGNHWLKLQSYPTADA